MKLLRSLLPRIILIGILGTAAFFLARIVPVDSPKEDSFVIPELSTLPLFSEPLEVLSVSLDELGYHTFSKDGRFFLFTGIDDSAEVQARTYAYDLQLKKIIPLPGFFDRGFENNHIVSIWKEQSLLLYDLLTDTTQAIPMENVVFGGVLSPDAGSYVFSTTEGLRLFDRTSQQTTTLTTEHYDGATAWFSDSARMLGFKANGTPLYDAGVGRTFGIWSIDDVVFTPITTSIPLPQSVRRATWIVPERIARVNTGYDDGSFDYLVDVTTGDTVEVGDTSGALMAGMQEDPEQGLFTAVGLYRFGSSIVDAVMYKGQEKIHQRELPGKNAFREYVQIIDENTLLYIKKTTGADYRIAQMDLVRFHFDTGVEEVLQSLPVNFSILSLTPDKKQWVVSSKETFITGSL